MRLYSLSSSTLIGTPRSVKQHTPKSFVPNPEVITGFYQAPTLKLPGKPFAIGTESSSLDTKEAALASSTGILHDTQQHYAESSEQNKSTTSSKPRLHCQSPLPRSIDSAKCYEKHIKTIDTASTASTETRDGMAPSNAAEFHFDIENEEATSSPFDEVPTVYSLDSPPSCFDVSSTKLEKTENPCTVRASIKILQDENHEEALESKSTDSSSTISSCSPSRTKRRKELEHATTFPGDFQKSDDAFDSRDEISARELPAPCNVEYSQTSPWKTGSESCFIKDEKRCATFAEDSSKDKLFHPILDAEDEKESRSHDEWSLNESQCPSIRTGRHVVSQTQSFESSFENVNEGESIVIMIHRKDAATGASTMRSYFRDELGRWTKFVSP